MMTLYEMLDKTHYDQRVWIFEVNAYDQHVTIYKGEIEGARTDTDSAWLYLLSEVESYYYASGILVIDIKKEEYNKKLDGWNDDRRKRGWSFSCEITEDLRKLEDTQ